LKECGECQRNDNIDKNHKDDGVARHPRPLNKIYFSNFVEFDVTCNRKLLDKQKKGKKRMRQFGKVDIPQEPFIAALKVDV